MPLDHTLAYKTKRQWLAEQERTGSTLAVEPNNHGVFWVYSAVPMQNLTVTLLTLTDHNAGFTSESVPVGPTSGGQLGSGIPDLSYGPFSNATELDFMEWSNSIPLELSREKAQAVVDMT